MKPKLNILKKTAKISEPMLDMFPSLQGGMVGIQIEVFDATAFCEAEEIEVPDYSVFYSACKRYIDARLENEQIPLSEVFYQNTDGHLLIHASILLTFLRFTIPDTSCYFDDIISSCLTRGIAFSDAFIMNMAMERLPNAAIQEILDSRNESGQQE